MAIQNEGEEMFIRHLFQELPRFRETAQTSCLDRAEFQKCGDHKVFSNSDAR